MHATSAMSTMSMSLRVSILATLLMLMGCASTTSDSSNGPVDDTLLAEAPFAGNWRSELDGSTLTIEVTGIFAIERPATGDRSQNKGVGNSVGSWTFDGTNARFTNLRENKECADLTGTYTAEVVRDTVRFTKVQDDCASREELMAWPWTRVKVSSSGAASSNSANK